MKNVGLSVLLLLLLLLLCGLCCVHAEEANPEKEVVDIPALRQAGDTLCASVVKKVDLLLPSSVHPLFTHHLQSLRSMVQIEWASINLNIEKDLKAAQAYVKNVAIVDAGLDGDASKWESYAEGRRPLIRGYVADHDRVFSYYTIRLPAYWDAQKPYQSLFYLHGHTPQPYMTWMVQYGFTGETAPAQDSNYYNIAIWGRGNSGYRYAGEIDLDHAISDFQNTFVYDKNKMALSGHSMGSYGAWVYAISRPDLWSAIALYSGSDRYAPLGSGLARNIAHIPVHIWHGAKDTTVLPEMAERFRAALFNYGNVAKVTIDAEAGHMVSKDAKKPNLEWLLGKERLRPNPLIFMAYSDRYNSAWGISLRVDPAICEHPSYSCQLEGNKVMLTTTGTTGLRINLGAETAEEKERRSKRWYQSLSERMDLGLSGEVEVYWNGILKYSGPVRELELGEGLNDANQQLKEAKKAAADAANLSLPKE